MSKIFRINLKYIVMICFFIIGVTCLSACSKTKLDSPDTFEINGCVLSWEAVDNAKNYTVRINDTDYETETASYDLQSISAGVNKVQVRSKEHDSYQQSDFGETLYIKKLDTPLQRQLSGNAISWSSIPEAKEYDLRLYNSVNELVYSAKTTQNQLAFSSISSYVQENEYCIVGISAIGNGKLNVLEDNTIIFATIPSSYNTGYVINYSNEMEKPESLTLDTENQQIKWTTKYYSAKYKLEIKDSNNDVVFTKNNIQENYVSINDNDIYSALTNTAKYKICVQALKTEEPIWILKDNLAIYTENNSKVLEREFDVDINAQLPQVKNMKFFGNSGYYTWFEWESVLGASLYNVKLLNNANEELYSGNTIYRNETIIKNIDNAVKNISESGLHKFIVSAIPNNSRLFVCNGKIVKYNLSSEGSTFDFNVTINDKIDAPTNIQIGGRYVDSQFSWYNINQGSITKSVDGYYVTIEDDNGEIVYERYDSTHFDNYSYSLLDTSLKSHLTKTGEYTLKVKSVKNNHITANTIVKTQMSDPAIFVFNYNLESNEITQ